MDHIFLQEVTYDDLFCHSLQLPEKAISRL